jgi:hypothetical protein
MKNTKNNKEKGCNWILRVIGFIGGVCIICFLKYSPVEIGTFFMAIYTKVGITIIALIPLSLWAVYSAVKSEKCEITLSYIGTTAQRVGLLGTVIGIVAATITIGDKLNAGAATAVTGALPAVGQALVSTAVGFIIAIICDFFIYINLQKCQLEEVKNEIV